MAYLCSWMAKEGVVKGTQDSDEAKRIFAEYLKRYEEPHIPVDTREIGIRYVSLISRDRGFAEIVE